MSSGALASCAAREVFKTMRIKLLLSMAIVSSLFFSLATPGSGQKSEDKLTADSALAELTAGKASVLTKDEAVAVLRHK